MHLLWGTQPSTVLLSPSVKRPASPVSDGVLVSSSVVLAIPRMRVNFDATCV